MSARYDLHAIQVALEGPCGWQSPAFAATLEAARRPFFGGMARANRRGLIGLR
jgi:hypothetical protein